MQHAEPGWRDRLTIIVTTSPLPRHPCSSMLEAILLSLHGFGGLAGCRTLIVADGYDASAVEGQALPQSVSQPLARASKTPHAHRTHTACTLPGAMEEG